LRGPSPHPGQADAGEALLDPLAGFLFAFDEDEEASRVLERRARSGHEVNGLTQPLRRLVAYGPAVLDAWVVGLDAGITPRLAVAVKVRKDQARAETFCRALPVQQLADLGGVRLGVNATGLKLRATQLGALQVVEVLRQEVDGAAGAVIMSVRIGHDCISTQAGLTGPACGASGFPLSSQFPLTSVVRGRGALAARG